MQDDPSDEGREESVPAEEELERQPDHVGQSGRWRKKDDDATPRRYGNEENTHSTEQGWPGPGNETDHPDEAR